MSELESKLSAARARLASREQDAAYAHRQYEAELATAEDKRVAILATRRDDTLAALATERDRISALVKAIEARDAETARQAAIAKWEEDQRTLAAMAKIARQVDADIVAAGARIGELVELAKRVGAGNDEIRRITAGTAHALIHAGVCKDILNSGEVLARRDLPHVAATVEKLTVAVRAEREAKLGEAA